MSRDSLLENLTDAQRQAVLHTEGPLLVLAGAGSGKTRVITRRAAHIARTVARPDQVLAVTFTNKAAGEMRERIQALAEAQGRGVWVSTFHSLCARLLREFGQYVGVQPHFTILDEADRRTNLRQAMENAGLHSDVLHPAVLEQRISDAKNRMLTAEKYAETTRNWEEHSIARAYRAYESLLHEQNALDFDDLLLQMATLLREFDRVRTALSDRFRYILIDEYQDTNHAQYLIASHLARAHRNICATGDPDQSIYAWRGADIRNILDFESEYPDAVTVRLEENFRSTAAILSGASSLIACNTRRKAKDLWSNRGPGDPIRIWAFEGQEEEARHVAQAVRSLLNEGTPPGAIAIFYRTNALTRAVEDALRAEMISYRIIRGLEFYARKEIKDVLAYLRIIVNPADDTALLRAINSPTRGIGKTTIEKLRTFASQYKISLGEALSRPEARAISRQLAAFSDLYSELRTLADPAKSLLLENGKLPIARITAAVIERSGIEAALTADGEESAEALENVRELITAAQQFEAAGGVATLLEWLTQISLVSDSDALDAAGGAVTLMTLHTAKGLEFPIVFIVGLEENLLPHARSIRMGTEEIEEERRLFFVGMTRAQNLLTLSHARYRMTRGITERTVASRFLSELPDDAVVRESFQTLRDRSLAHLGRFNLDELQSDTGEYFPGQRVGHRDYGIGQVIRVEPRGKSMYIRIFFEEHGERAFALEHVSLYVPE